MNIIKNKILYYVIYIKFNKVIKNKYNNLHKN